MNQNYLIFCQIGKNVFLVCYRILAASSCVPQVEWSWKPPAKGHTARMWQGQELYAGLSKSKPEL